MNRERLRGLRALVTDAVAHGTTAIERVHQETSARTFVVLEQLPLTAGPARLVHVLHDASVSSVYSSIRLINRAVGAALDAVLSTRTSP